MITKTPPPLSLFHSIPFSIIQRWHRPRSKGRIRSRLVTTGKRRKEQQTCCRSINSQFLSFEERHFSFYRKIQRDENQGSRIHPLAIREQPSGFSKKGKKRGKRKKKKYVRACWNANNWYYKVLLNNKPDTTTGKRQPGLITLYHRGQDNLAIKERDVFRLWG